MNVDWAIVRDIIVAVCGLIPTIVSVICLIVNIIKNKNWQLVEEIAKQAMSSAEEFAKTHPEMTGEDKLNLALEAVKSGLAAAKIKVDEALIKQVIEYIKQMCSWSKTVNTGTC